MGFFDLDNQSEEARDAAGPDPPREFRTRSVPQLFLVCRESYRVAMEKIYEKSFGSQYGLPKTWFNFDLDTLYLDWGYYDGDDLADGNIFFEFSPREIGAYTKRVRSLAIYKGDHPIIINPGYFIDHVLATFGNVQNLCLAAPDYKLDDSGDLVFLEFDDVVDDPAYSDDIHPAVREIFPGMEN